MNRAYRQAYKAWRGIVTSLMRASNRAPTNRTGRYPRFWMMHPRKRYIDIQLPDTLAQRPVWQRCLYGNQPHLLFICQK